MSDQRQHPRVELNSTVLISNGLQAWLAHVNDISAGGARVLKPLDWLSPGVEPVTLHFIFDQDTVISVRASLVRDAPDHLGFWFKSGQEEAVGRLVYESRFAGEI